MRPGESETLLQEERATTRFVFVSNLLQNEHDADWDEPFWVAQAIRSAFAVDVEVFVNHKSLSKYCHLGFRSAEEAQQAVATYQGKQVEWKWAGATGTEHSITSGMLFLDYASITKITTASSAG